MKTLTKATLALAALGVSALMITAQDANGPQGGQNGQGDLGRPGSPGGQRPPPIAVLGALDANHDGIIDETEIANASAQLLTLDKNGDGKLTPDEFIGPKPPRGPGGAGGREGRHGPPPDANSQPDQQPQQ